MGEYARAVQAEKLELQQEIRRLRAKLVARVKPGGVARLDLQLNRQQVDFRGENEIVLGEAADGVRPDLNKDVAKAGEVDLRMMSFPFGKFGHAVNEVDAGHEVLDVPLLLQP